MTKLTLFALAVIIIYISQKNHAKDLEHAASSFRMYHPNFLNSFSYQSNVTVEEKAERLSLFSKARVESFENFFNDNFSYPREINSVIRAPIHHNSLFLVEMGIGTFSGSPGYKTYFLVLDTAGGLIWTQCQGCNPCFHQRDPYFPRSMSSTYHVLPCNQCPRGTRCEQDHCTIDVSYLDGTRVQGISATETFTFTTNIVGSLLKKKDLHFACVIRSQNCVFDRHDNIASGVFGMSRDPSSFISQAGERFRGRFSYCLTPIDYQGQRPPMFLRFGNDIPRLSLLNRHSTPFIRAPTPYYNLHLQAISIGSQRLNINPSLFHFRQDGSGGCFIDSGCMVSYLINAAYIEFERVLMQNIITKYPGIMITSREPKLCYKQPRPGVRTVFPRVTFHFANNADFVTEQEAYMMGFAHPNPQVYCLMIRPSNTTSIFGAFQQVSHRIIYDTMNSELHFAPENCLANN